MQTRTGFYSIDHLYTHQNYEQDLFHKPRSVIIVYFPPQSQNLVSIISVKKKVISTHAFDSTENKHTIAPKSTRKMYDSDKLYMLKF